MTPPNVLLKDDFRNGFDLAGNESWWPATPTSINSRRYRCQPQKAGLWPLTRR